MQTKYMDYETIKKLAKERGVKVKDLLALSIRNDPFYVGAAYQQKWGHWFADLWSQFGYDQISDVHVRRVFYRVISQDPPILTPNGQPCTNTRTIWDNITDASKYARWLELVDVDAFIDRRANKPIENIQNGFLYPVIDVESDYSSELEFPELPEMPRYELSGFEANQRYHLEVWCEKSTINDILEPICRRYEVNLVTGVGELSITQVRLLYHRLMEYEKPCRVFYLSDFDPGGQSMPVAVARKIEYFLRENTDVDVKLYPLILTHDQCLEYKLPRTPIKESEVRKDSFEKHYCEGATELDALEALHPGEIHRILKEAIEQYYDSNIGERILSLKETVASDLNEIRNRVLADYYFELDSIESEYDSIKEEFGSEFEALNNRFERLRQAVNDRLEARKPDIDLDDLPEPRVADEIENPLYDSDREYFDQLEIYHKFQNK